MPLRLPRPPAELIEAFEAEMARTDAVMTAVAEALGETAEGEPEPRVPQTLWLLGAMPVEDLPRGSKLNRQLAAALRVRLWRFFVGLDDGGHVELDFQGGAIVSATYRRPGESGWLSLLSRASLLWAMTTAGNNEARLVEFPWLNIRAVRAAGPDAGIILDELWDAGVHGAPMTEEDFAAYVLRRYAAKRAASADTAA